MLRTNLKPAARFKAVQTVLKWSRPVLKPSECCPDGFKTVQPDLIKAVKKHQSSPAKQRTYMYVGTCNYEWARPIRTGSRAKR